MSPGEFAALYCHSAPLTSLWNASWQCEPQSSISCGVGKGVRGAPAVGFETHSICQCKGSKMPGRLAFSRRDVFCPLSQSKLSLSLSQDGEKGVVGYLSLLPTPAPSPSQLPGFASWTGSSLMPSDLGGPNQAGSQGTAHFLASLLRGPCPPASPSLALFPLHLGWSRGAGLGLWECGPCPAFCSPALAPYLLTWAPPGTNPCFSFLVARAHSETHMVYVSSFSAH